jgi:hypothetical protein
VFGLWRVGRSADASWFFGDFVEGIGIVGTQEAQRGKGNNDD